MLELTPLTDADVNLLKRWLFAPHVAKWYAQPQDWLDEVAKRNDEYRWLHHFIARCDGRPIGFCQYYAYRDGGETWHGRMDTAGVYSIDYMIGEADCIGKGLGKAVVQALIERIRLHEDAVRIIVQPEPENRASCATLAACGFDFDEHAGFYTYTIRRISHT